MTASKLPAAHRSPLAPPGAPGRRVLQHDPPALTGAGAEVVIPLQAPDDRRAAGLPLEWQRIRRYAGGALLVLCFVLFGWQAWRGRAPAPVEVDAPAHAPGQGNGADLRVQVTGAVAAPGVYRLSTGDRVEDAVRAAGGFAENADATRVNLAQRVRDEQRLEIPAVGPAPAGPDGAAPAAPAAAGPNGPGSASGASGASGASATRAAPPAQSGLSPASLGARSAGGPPGDAAPPSRVNVNTATAAELEALPGIGEVTARRILAYREAHGRVRSLDELRQAGIPDSLLRRAAGRLVFE